MRSLGAATQLCAGSSGPLSKNLWDHFQNDGDLDMEIFIQDIWISGEPGGGSCLEGWESPETEGGNWSEKTFSFFENEISLQKHESMTCPRLVDRSCRY